MSVFCLGADEIDAHWNELEPHLRRLERLGYVDPDIVRSDLKAERKQLWGYQCDGMRSIAITRITKSGVCEICDAVGKTDPQQIHEVLAAIEQWAKSINCTKVRLQGRMGWLRVLKGYAQTGVILEKEF